MKKRSVHVVVLAVLSLLLLGPVPNSLARPGGAPRLEARRPVPKAIEVGTQAAAGYGTGTAIHADALRVGEHSLLGLDVSFSGSAWSSVPLAGDIVNEVRRKVATKLPDKLSFGRGAGLELGVLSEPQALIGQLSSAAAPESTDLINKVVGPIEIPNIIRAELLRSQAQARAIEGGCVLGPDKGYGLGSVLNLEVLGGLIATNARPPYREVVQSSSTTRIVKGSTPGRLGLKSETRQTIAPVTFFKGLPIQFTVEVLGEWALRAVADGAKGEVHYGPMNPSPQTPIVRILNAKGHPVAELTTQMLLGRRGLHIELPGVAEIAVGEPPRMIGEGYESAPIVEDGAAVAAVDVVRVRLLDSELADVRIGHMEAAVTVPDGGVQCPGLNVDNTVDPDTVTAGDPDGFIYTITVTNPNDCVLKDVRVVETPKAKADGVKFELVSVTPPVAGGVSADDAVFPDLGPLGPGESKTVTVKVTVPGDSAPGPIEALAVATGVCPPALQPSSDTDGTQNPTSPQTPDIPVRGEDLAEGPDVVAPTLREIQTCTVPPLVGKTVEEAKVLLEAAGCKLGDVTNDPNGKPEDAGKITGSNPKEGDKVPVGTEVDITISPKPCTVPNLVGMTEAEARDALEKAGCRIGDVTPGPDSSDPGKITEQGTPSGTLVPAGTDVDITISGPVCTIPNLVGMSEAEAKAAVEAQGCTLRVDNRPTSDPSQVGKVTTQNPAANLHVPKGSTVDVTLGVQVLGETEVKSQAQEAGNAPALVRTGGVALGGVALWLLFSGLLTQAAGSTRLWRLIRRHRG